MTTHGAHDEDGDRTDDRDRTNDRAPGGGHAEGRDRTPAYDPELIARRASSFGAEAAAYADHRPDYPEAAVRWALEPALARFGATLDVLDLGAGTGKLSAVVAGAGHRVTAVEPDADMLAELRRRVPAATALAGSAEEIPLPDASVDAVVVGQAFHWFDQDKALPEIARVLRPGGSLTALSNADDDRVEWIAGLGEVSASQVSFVNWGSGRRIREHPAFLPVQAADFPHHQRRTVESMVATVATHSHVLVQAPAEREGIKERVRAYLRSRPETASGEFDLPLVCRGHRCVRRAN